MREGGGRGKREEGREETESNVVEMRGGLRTESAPDGYLERPR